MLQALQGKKTYIVAILGIVYAITGVLTGNLDVNAAVTLIWAALAAAGIRHGISTTLSQ